ncbi:hypothetical protein [Mangrovimonas futianensis]|uniref:hypothetical protein n=2 Tax=Mangrovimonas futianensis TaxID=2895523 RepID=UPI001E51A332|nr:hypothetical protein [Mangrovimonas futianensis]MCF1194940.1 hypothetical protein [Mangrovimonas futianensis]
MSMSPKKKKLFIDSTDVSHMTGQCIRSARRMLKYVRDERGLTSRSPVSIYDFCYCFSVPLNVVFEYINSTRFENLPSMTQEELRQGYMMKEGKIDVDSYLHHPDFDIFCSPKSLKNRSQDLEDDNAQEIA